jgi:hypothetical protein
VLGREFATNFPGQGVSVSNIEYRCFAILAETMFYPQGSGSVITAPPINNIYRVFKGFSVDPSLASDAEVESIVQGWAGKTFSGPWSGVNWTVQSVSC